jgi:hypothetical protein
MHVSELNEQGVAQTSNGRTAAADETIKKELSVLREKVLHSEVI